MFLYWGKDISCDIFWRLPNEIRNLAAGTMHKRYLATTVLALAVVFSQTGSFVIAALCPHLSSKARSCDSQAPAESAHHDMDHMQMESTGPQFTLTTDSTAAAVTEPIGSCKHCAVHSRTSPNTGSLGEWSIPQRSVDLTISLPVAKVTAVPTLPVVVLPSRAHGPPRNKISRHVLLSIFRI